MAQLNISIPSALKGWIDARVAEGRHSSPSDYIRDLIRRDQDAEPDQKAWLQAMIDEGMASPTLDRDAYQVLDEVIARGIARHGESGSQS
jgi:antitoxin ParD1/3/4